MAVISRKRAKDAGYRDDMATVALVIGIMALLLSLINGIVGIYIQIAHPDIMDKMLRDLGLG
jgi:hypothetical protein